MAAASLHRWAGAVVLLVFLGTGIHMRLRFPELYGGSEVVRFLYRANHIYLLAAGLVNLAIGLAALDPPPGWRRKIWKTGSVLVLAAPAVLLVAYLLEPSQASPERPLTQVGMIALTAGTLLHLPGRARIGTRT